LTSSPSNQGDSKKEAKYLKRLKLLEAARLPQEALWRRITRYILPLRSVWERKGERSSTEGRDIYDGTALAALTLMCDGLLGHLVPAAIPFFHLRSGIERFENIPIFRQWLDQAELHLLAALDRSNFYSALGELFPDSGGLGTGIMYMEEDIAAGRVNFSVRHLKECYVSENRWGVVDTLYRVFELSYRNMVDQFPNVSEKIKKKAKDTPDEMAEILHAVEPSGDGFFDSAYILLTGQARQDSSLLDEGTYDFFPYIAWRFRKNSEEAYGRCPGTDSIWDVEMLNVMAKSLQEAADKATRPPLVASEAMRGRIRINPNGITYVDGVRGVSGQVQTLYGGALGQYPIGIDAYERKSRMVREHFRSDFFSYLLQEAAGASSQRTATEINAIEAQKAAVLGSTIGRVTKEVFEPVIRNMFAIEYAAHRLPALPEELVQLVGAPLEIEYTGPLARKQRQYLQSQGILEGAAAAINIAVSAGKPEMLDNFNWDYIAQQAADASGMPQAALLDPKLVDKIRANRAAQIQAQQQAAMQLEAAKALPGLSKAPEPGSPAEAMAGGRR
jgi:hypothetical protein